MERGGGGGSKMSAPSTSGLSVELLLRVIDVAAIGTQRVHKSRNKQVCWKHA